MNLVSVLNLNAKWPPPIAYLWWSASSSGVGGSDSKAHFTNSRAARFQFDSSRRPILEPPISELSRKYRGCRMSSCESHWMGAGDVSMPNHGCFRGTMALAASMSVLPTYLDPLLKTGLNGQ